MTANDLRSRIGLVSDLLCVSPKSSPLNFLARDPEGEQEIGGDVIERVIANRIVALMYNVTKCVSQV